MKKSRLIPTICFLLAASLIFCSIASSQEQNKQEQKKADDSNASDNKQADSEKESANTESEVKSDEDPLKEILAGHSYHGDAFNEGPRQKAYLMGGTGPVKFEVTTSHDEVQKFIEQGIGQLHGFWDLEAERSFRHAAALDPDCAMAYWGAALATKRNAKRSRGFIDEAVKRKSKVSKREQKYIDALNAYIPKAEKKDDKKSDDKNSEKKLSEKEKKEAEKKKKEAERKKRTADRDAKKKRAENYTKALESIALEFPNDIEAKAFLALQLYNNRSQGIPIISYLAANGLMEEIFKAEPMHPTHHFRIHLWDLKKPEMALRSAATCGQTSPSIAHMWHMPGHIYSRLKRYEDAVWQQEASARVDHAHMMRDRVMPDEIGNFAHNNEWMIRNLVFIGAVQKAIDLSKNMSELPRHPKYNSLEKRGSNRYGRERLFQVLNKFGVWDQTIELCNSVYLEATSVEKEQRNRLRALGIALFMNGDTEKAGEHLASVQKIIDDEKAKEAVSIKDAEEKAAKDFEEKWSKDVKSKEKSEEEKAKALKSALEKAKNEAVKKHKEKYGTYETVVNAIEGYKAITAKDYKTAYDKLKKAGGEDETLLAELKFLKAEKAEDKDKALAEIKKSIDKRKNEVIPHSRYAYLLDLAGKTDEAKKAFEELRKISSSIDMTSGLFTRLSGLAKKCGYEGDWRNKLVVADDTGVRPSLDDLGPIHWKPSPAPNFQLTKSDGGNFQLSDYKGRPVILIFYLGASCLHCAEQLQAFAPEKENFELAGFDIVAISTDDQTKLRQSLADYGDKMPIPLVSNSELDVFKKFRAYDDFEKQPLHGTFLIDGDGLIRWQDIGFEPFMDHKFLLKESQRLVAQKNTGRLASTETRNRSVVDTAEKIKPATGSEE